MCSYDEIRSEERELWPQSESRQQAFTQLPVWNQNLDREKPMNTSPQHLSVTSHSIVSFRPARWRGSVRWWQRCSLWWRSLRQQLWAERTNTANLNQSVSEPNQPNKTSLSDFHQFPEQNCLKSVNKLQKNKSWILKIKHCSCELTSLVVETGSAVLRREVREEMLLRLDNG